LTRFVEICFDFNLGAERAGGARYGLTLSGVAAATSGGVGVADVVEALRRVVTS